MSGVGARSRQVLAWAVILGVAAALTLAVVVPRIGGGTPYAVLTGSMRPDHPPGTLVVVRPVAPEEVSVGDVVTYQQASGVRSFVTHRVTAVSASLSGELRYTTRGDANEVADSEPVRPVQLRGRLWYSVPVLGHVHTALTDSQRRTAVLVAAGGLAAYAVAMFVLALRERRKAVVA